MRSPLEVRSHPKIVPTFPDQCPCLHSAPAPLQKCALCLARSGSTSSRLVTAKHINSLAGTPHRPHCMHETTTDENCVVLIISELHHRPTTSNTLSWTDSQCSINSNITNELPNSTPSNSEHIRKTVSTCSLPCHETPAAPSYRLHMTILVFPLQLLFACGFPRGTVPNLTS